MYERREIAPGILKYAFPPGAIPRVTHNVFVLVSGKRAAVIDPSYPAYAARVRDDLSSEGIEVGDVVISHYHADHCQGTAAFSGRAIWGSPAWERSLPPSVGPDARKFLAPSREIELGEEYEIAGFPIRFRDGSGHAACGLLVEIGASWLHANDLVAFDIDGSPILPLAFHDPRAYSRSLEAVASSGRELLIPHMPFADRSLATRQLTAHALYLKLLIERGEDFGRDEIEAACGCRFAFLDKHENNQKSLAVVLAGGERCA